MAQIHGQDRESRRHSLPADDEENRTLRRRLGLGRIGQMLDGVGWFDDKAQKADDGTMIVASPTGFQHRIKIDEAYNWVVDAEEVIVVEEKLGEGAYGAVFKGRLRGTDDEIAIKMIPFLTPDSFAKIQKEFDLLTKCNHPNVVTYFGQCKKDSYLWIMMQYCDAGSLVDVMEVLRESGVEKLPENVIAAILVQTLRGLAFLHQGTIRVIHRDLKSGNLLLTSDGYVKIADFGISFEQTATRSKAMTLVGTPLFMAPEILDGQRYSYSADIWSFGITAIEIADGVPPYASEHPMRALFLISNGDPPTLSKTAGWSPEFHSFVSSCLKKDPSQRASAEDLLQHPFLKNVSSKESNEAIKLTKEVVDQYFEAKSKKAPKKEVNLPHFTFTTLSDTLPTPVARSASVPSERWSVPAPITTTYDNIPTGNEHKNKLNTIRSFPTIEPKPKPARTPISEPEPKPEPKPKPKLKPRPMERSSSQAMFESMGKGALQMMDSQGSVPNSTESSLKSTPNDESISNDSDTSDSDSGESSEPDWEKEFRFRKGSECRTTAKVNRTTETYVPPDSTNSPQSGTLIFWKEMQEGVRKSISQSDKFSLKERMDKKAAGKRRVKKKKRKSKSLIQMGSSDRIATSVQRASSDIKKSPLRPATLEEVKGMPDFDKYIGMSVLELVFEIAHLQQQCEEQTKELDTLREIQRVQTTKGAKSEN